MEYSLEVLEAKKKWFQGRGENGRKILFLKVDCSDAEIGYLERNRLIQSVIYENYVGDFPEVSFAVGAYNLVRRGRTEKEKRKDDEYFMNAHIKQVTLRDALAGVGIYMYEHHIPHARAVILEALVEIGEPMRANLEGGSYRGETGRV